MCLYQKLGTDIDFSDFKSEFNIKINAVCPYYKLIKQLYKRIDFGFSTGVASLFPTYKATVNNVSICNNLQLKTCT